MAARWSTSTSPNVATMVDAGRTCLLAAAEPDSVAQAVVSLVGDRELRERLGRAGAAEATRRTWSRTAGMFEESLLRTCFVRTGRRHLGRQWATASSESSTAPSAARAGSPRCSSNRTTNFPTGVLRLVACRDCRLVFLNPRMTLDAIVELEDESDVYAMDATETEHEIAARIELLRGIGAPP